MTPIDPNELRRELHSVDPGYGTQPGPLGEAVIRRGQTIKRRRAAIASVAALAVVAGGFGAAQLIPMGGRDAVPAEPVVTNTVVTPSPAPSPSPTEVSTPVEVTESPVPVETTEPTQVVVPDPTASTTASGDVVEPVETPEPPAPIWTDTMTIPGDIGDIGTIALPNEGGPGDEISSPWEPTDWSYVCLDVLDFPSLTQLQGARSIESSGGEASNREGVLVFRSVEGAQQFMQELNDHGANCQARSDALEADESVAEQERLRTLYHYASEDPDQVLIAEYTEIYLPEWEAIPGGGATYWERDGQSVAFAGTGGEFLGNIAEIAPDVVDELNATVTEILNQA